MKNMLKEKQGITLVALVITIIVLIILAGVTLSMVVGDSGIITKAKEAKQNMQNATAEEGELLQNMLNTMNEIESGIGGPVEPPKENIPTTKAYVGYYADFEGDGTPDGIIYADLAVGNTGDGQWVNDYGNYTIPVEDNLKNYYISETKQNGPWGEKYAVIPKEGTGKDRFYVMALSDIDESTHYWYKSAEGKMSIDTSQDFGTGKQNTQTMINQWNGEKYLPNDNNDMWKLIQNQVEQGWFVPSRAEWSAFAEELKITEKNYINFELSYWYHSSSQFDVYGACAAGFGLRRYELRRCGRQRLRSFECDFLIYKN